MAQRNDIPEGDLEFYKELNEFEIRLPGNVRATFSCDGTWLQMAKQRYPKWRDQGRVTSVPVSRVPKLFIDSEQMHEDLKKEVKLTTKGEEAEQLLYQLFIKNSGEPFKVKDQPGVMIFPNFDGSHIFKSQVAHVEIDMILIHPTKGAFVFNVKNKGSSRKCTKEKQCVRDDIEKHTKFIRLLINYNSEVAVTNLPIHSVVCDFASEKSIHADLEKKKVLVLRKNDLTKTNFVKSWCSKLADVECKANAKDVDLLAARLIALASIEGAAVLISDKLKRGLLQSVSNLERLETQLKPYDAKDFIAKISELSKTEKSQNNADEGQKGFILWSKDQLEVIGRIYAHLTKQLRGGGARILVKGGKGTGKTMLLVFLAKMAHILLESKQEETEICPDESEPNEEKKNKKTAVLVCNADVTCRNFTAALRDALECFDVTVEDLKPNNLQEQLRSFKMILCDEAKDRINRILLENVRKEQHLVLFTAEKKRNVDQRFKQFLLRSCLRSTSQLAWVSNTYHARQLKHVSVHTACPSKTFHGEYPDVRWADESCPAEKSNGNDLMRKSVEAIRELAAEPGLDFVVVPLIRQDLLQKIVDDLSRDHLCNVDEDLGTLRLKSGVEVEKRNRNQTKINFFYPRTIEGFEFSKVLILLENNSKSFFQFTDSDFFTACTRACLKLLVVTDACTEQNEVWWQDIYRDFLRSEVDKLLTGISSDEKTPSVMFVGQMEHLLESLKFCRTEQGPEYLSFPSTVYEKDGRRFFHSDDVYLESHLAEMSEKGVKRILFMDDNITDIWQHYFTALSRWFCFDFSRRHANCFQVEDWLEIVHELNFQMKFRRAFLRRISGHADVTFPRFWLKLEMNSLPSPVLIGWEKWIMKAEKCHEKGYITQAIFIYECGMKTLQQQITSNGPQSSLRKKLADLSRFVSEVYIKSIKIIVEESKCSYWVPTTQYEVCLLKAFRHAANALKWHASDANSKFQLLERIFQEMGKYPKTELFVREVELMNKDDTSGMIFETRLRHELPQTPIQVFRRFKESLCELETLICNYEKRIFESTDPDKMKKSISELARKLVEKKVCPLSEVNQNDDAFQEALSKMMVKLDYPVQLAMIAVHWDHTLEKNLSLLSRALACLKRSFELVKANAGLPATASNGTPAQ